jgi:hypothetical protein
MDALWMGGILLTRRLKLSDDQVIFGANPLLAVESFEATHRKMTKLDVLEMVDECVVYRAATEGTDYGDGLRGHLLRDHQSEARGDLSTCETDGRTTLDFG